MNNKNLQKSRIFNENGNFFCEICQNITTNVKKSFYRHLATHNISLEDYYRQYLMGEGEDICKGCKKPKKFLGIITEGFKTFCSNKCAQNDEGTRKRGLETIKVKYGSHKAYVSHVKEKSKETYREKYGVDHYFQSDEFKAKNDYSAVFHKSNDKRIATNLTRYGTSNVFAAAPIKEKIKQTNLENHGVENWQQSESAKRFHEEYWTDERKEAQSDNLKAAMSIKAVENLTEELEGKYEILEKIEVDGVKHLMYSYKLRCEKGHEFVIQRQLIRLRQDRNVEMCLTCNPIVSSISQSEILNFVKEVVGEEVEVIQNYRKAWGGKMEIDIFIPSYNLGIEYNSNYYHSEVFKPDKHYHLNKTLACQEKGIKLIHIWEDQWMHKREIVQSRLRNLLRKNPVHINANQCKLKEVSFQETKNFLIENHIQGWCVSKVNLGLYFKDRLVSIMTFGANRVNTGRSPKEGEYELLRYCNALNHSVSFSASRLFTNFCRMYNPDKVHSFCDRAWSNGDVYDKIGFSFDHASDPGFSYIIDGIRHSRWKFQKATLVEMGHSEDLTEREIMSKLGHSRIYDCGNLVFEWRARR